MPLVLSTLIIASPLRDNDHLCIIFSFRKLIVLRTPLGAVTDNDGIIFWYCYAFANTAGFY